MFLLIRPLSSSTRRPSSYWASQVKYYLNMYNISRSTGSNHVYWLAHFDLRYTGCCRLIVRPIELARWAPIALLFSWILSTFNFNIIYIKYYFKALLFTNTQASFKNSTYFGCLIFCFDGEVQFSIYNSFLYNFNNFNIKHSAKLLEKKGKQKCYICEQKDTIIQKI